MMHFVSLLGGVFIVTFAKKGSVFKNYPWKFSHPFADLGDPVVG